MKRKKSHAAVEQMAAFANTRLVVTVRATLLRDEATCRIHKTKYNSLMSLTIRHAEKWKS